MAKHIAEQFPLPGIVVRATFSNPPAKEYKRASVLNRTEVKRRLLQYAADTKSHPFKRVSKATLDSFEARLESLIRRHVVDAPSRGTTL